MANFCSQPKGDWMTEITIPNSKVVRIGLYGFLDFQGKELRVLAPPYISVKKAGDRGHIRLYDLYSYHPGIWTLEAITKDNVTWAELRVTVQHKATNAEWSGDSAQWTQEKKLLSLEPAFRAKVRMVLETLREQGFQPHVFYGWRSVAVQQRLVAEGKSTVRFSFHNAQKPDGTPNAYAADIIDKRWSWGRGAQTNGFWSALGDAGKAQGLVWGGDWTGFPDVAHVQGGQNSELATVKRESGL